MALHQQHLSGLQLLRVIAIGMVFAQHAITHVVAQPDIGVQLWLGQSGVAVFLAVSGFLAARTRDSAPVWLQKRLVRIYPAYWLALLGSFLLAGVAGHKSFDWRQVVSQFAGTGYLTHADNLVNSPTWFITLIVGCYLWSAITKAIGCEWTAASCGAIAAMIGLATGPAEYAWLWSHVLTYLLAVIVGKYAALQTSLVRLLILPAVPLCLMLIRPEFGLSAIGLFSLLAAGLVTGVPRFIDQAADCSYEFYLVHGPCLSVAAKLFGSRPWLVITAGLVAASIAARVLQSISNRLVRGVADSGNRIG